MTVPTAVRPAAASAPAAELSHETFARAHLGSSAAQVQQMLEALGQRSLESLVSATVPADIRLPSPLTLSGSAAEPCSEHQALAELRQIAQRNRVLRSYIGMGYYDTLTPPVIQRNILENPGWYTQYTPYQAEISQGRLEALLNFQTMVGDLTALPLANASLLDEATAAAEAMTMAHHIAGDGRSRFLAASDCHPQTLAVLRTRAEAQGVQVEVVDAEQIKSFEGVFGVLVQYPGTDGRIADYSGLATRVHAGGAVLIASTDLLALTVLKAPGEWGADIAIGSAQRFGVPMGFGGPHAAFLSTRTEHARRMPGRIIGVSRDSHGKPALRLAIQTREQHIKRDRATSNICTAQVLLAVMAGMYATWHGPEGLRQIAHRVQWLTQALALGFERLFERAGADTAVLHADACFDTLTFQMSSRDCVLASLAKARELGCNLRDFGDHRLGISLDETTTLEDVRRLWSIAGSLSSVEEAEVLEQARERVASLPQRRESAFLTQSVFNQYHTEHELLRYIHRLQARDLSLTTSMIPLGSCTMKLNAAAEMFPVTWREFGAIHPFAPADQTRGYQQLFEDLERWLATITGFAAVSLQPNAGSQGEYAGLLVIRAYHHSRGQSHRDVCLIPVSAHGTNPATAVMAGFKVVPVECKDNGDVDLADLAAKAAQHSDRLAAVMVTYPSTHGVFETGIRELCSIVHRHGGQVYMDGANMNAQVGLTSPGHIGADVCHLNLHKTFCIPHGGGGPGMGPIAVAAHLAPFLPTHPVASPESAGKSAIGAVSAAPYGSPSILPIPWMYIRMMAGQGLTQATQIAILNANYMARRLQEHYDVLFRGQQGQVAHEFILDCRGFQKSAGVSVEDIAKRLMDFGYHAPTMSWPVAGTLMIEPTESESKAELDRFCDALIAIREEIRRIEAGELDRNDNPLRHAPHTAQAVISDQWKHKYPRELAAYPAPWLRDHKFWPSVGRVDNPYGDRNLICTCEGLK